MVTSQLNDVISNVFKNVNQAAYKLGHLTETILLLINNNFHLAFSRDEASAAYCLTNCQHLIKVTMVLS